MIRALSIAIDGMLLGGNFSGVEESILGLAQSLASDGRHKYHLYIPDAAACPDIEGINFHTERVRIAPSRLTRILWEQRTLPRNLKTSGFDLLHAPAYLAPLASPIPVVLTVYDLQALLHPSLCLPLNRINYRIMLPRSIRKARGIIVPSRSVARDLTRLFPAASDKLKVIPIGLNPVFREIEEGICAAALKRHGIASPFILFAGNMARNKNLLTLIESFAMLKRDNSLPHKLVLAGRATAQHKKIRRAITEKGLSEEVICTGYLPEADLVAFFNAADLFVFPSLYEGFGLPPLEAMACGTPVLCAEIEALKETAGTAAAFVDPGCPGAMASAIRRLIQDRAVHSELKAKGLVKARSFGRIDAMLQTEAFYDNIMASE